MNFSPRWPIALGGALLVVWVALWLHPPRADEPEAVLYWPIWARAGTLKITGGLAVAAAAPGDTAPRVVLLRGRP